MLKTVDDRAFSVAGPRELNHLSGKIRECQTLGAFKRKLKIHLFRAVYGHLCHITDSISITAQYIHELMAYANHYSSTLSYLKALCYSSRTFCACIGSYISPCSSYNFSDAPLAR